MRSCSRLSDVLLTQQRAYLQIFRFQEAKNAEDLQLANHDDGGLRP